MEVQVAFQIFFSFNGSWKLVKIPCTFLVVVEGGINGG